MKTGWKTTEFYITILTDIGLVAASVAQVLPAHWAVIGAGVAQAAYSISRGLAKTTAPRSTAP